MEFINKIFDYLLDREKSFDQKSSTVIIILIIVLLVNNLLGISFNYYANQKIAQVKMIEEIKKECNNEAVLTNIETIESEIFNRKTLFDQFVCLFSSEPYERDKLQIESTISSYPSKELNFRNQLTHTLTSAWVFVVLFFMSPLFLIGRSNINAGDIVVIILFMLFFAICIWIMQWIFGLIPLIFNIPLVNYSLNVVLQLSVFYLIYLVYRTKPKRNKEPNT